MSLTTQLKLFLYSIQMKLDMEQQSKKNSKYVQNFGVNK